MKTLHDHELAAYAEITELENLSWQSFQKCSPQESQLFPKDLSAERKEEIFIAREMRDLKSCKAQDCAFNFTAEERDQIGALESDEEIQKTFFEFYKSRVEKPRELHPLIEKFKISKVEPALSVCQGPELKALVEKRPLKDWPYRLASVRYESQMRPTTRLTQGKHFKENGNFCFAEALIFSNHYDVELLKVWRYQPEEKQLRVELRYRVDFLSTWFRRLQKPRLQAAIEEVLTEEMESFKNCVNSGA